MTTLKEIQHFHLISVYQWKSSSKKYHMHILCKLCSAHPLTKSNYYYLFTQYSQ